MLPEHTTILHLAFALTSPYNPPDQDTLHSAPIFCAAAVAAAASRWHLVPARQLTRGAELLTCSVELLRYVCYAACGELSSEAL